MKRKNNNGKIVLVSIIIIMILGIFYYFQSYDGMIIENINILEFNDDVIIKEVYNNFRFDTSSLSSSVAASNSIKYTNQNVVIYIHVKMDNFNYVKYPDGTVSKNIDSTYEITKNGKYVFLLYDMDNNYKEKVIEIKKIDKTAPTGSCIANVLASGKTVISIDGKDELSGIKNYVYFGDGKEIKSGTENKYTHSAQLSSVYVVIYDNATNNASIVCDVKTEKKKEETPTTPNPNVTIKTHDQRSEAMIYYSNMSSKNVKDVDKKYKCSKVICDVPNSYYPNMKGNIKLYTYNEKTNEKTFVKTITKDIAPYVMVPNVTYYLEEESNQSKNEYIKLTGDLRTINVDGTRNVRDLGGYKADGGKIKYGKLIRGANPNHHSDDESTTKIFSNLGINVIFDLRETSSWKKVKDKYLTSFEKMNSDTGYYLSSTKYKNTRESVEQIMKQVVSGKNVYFHCAIGTDRTGTVANLLEGILGVSNELRLNDYELSYFYRHKSGTTRNGSIKYVYKKVSKFGGSDDQEKYINWFLSDSKNVQEDINLINNFRKAMIDGTPTFYKVENKKCVKMEEQASSSSTSTDQKKMN